MSLNKRIFKSASSGGGAPAAPLRFNEVWFSADSPYHTCGSSTGSGSAEIKNSGKIIDFNNYIEGQCDTNHYGKTTGKWYVEVKILNFSGHGGFALVDKTSDPYNTTTSGNYAGTNPLDADYGLALYNGSVYRDGVSVQTGVMTMSSLNVICVAFDAATSRVWFGKRTNDADTTVSWQGDPLSNSTGYNTGMSNHSFFAFHASESVSRYSEFEVLDFTEALTPPTGYSYLGGDFTATETTNCTGH